MKRNKFNLSHYRLITADMGKLVPLTCFEVLPGDSIQMSTSALIRVTPLVSPVMHPVLVRINHWFCPYRLIWEDWEDFITGGEDGQDSSVPPYISAGSVGVGSLPDYLGVPPDTYSPNLEYSALPVRMYQMIWNEHFRDQDLVTEAALDVTDGLDSTTSGALQSVAWEKDYFTTCRPWETKGAEVTIPLGDAAPVTGIGKANQSYLTGPVSAYETDGSGSVSYADYETSNGAAFYIEEDPDNSGYPNIRADLSAATGVDINDLRLALAVQRYQERMARYGSRYNEWLAGYGIRGLDSRLQRPEYLGGGRQVIQFSEVLHHAEGTDPVGAMKGHGIAALRSNRFRKFFPEHGMIMTLMSVVPKPIYVNGLHRMFTREVKEDFFQKELEFLGDQAVRCDEVYADAADRDGVFGYQSRYDEYRTLPSGIAGQMRSTYDDWHFGRDFAAEPSLNSTFVQAAPTTRPFANTNDDCLFVMANHSVVARRMLSKFAKPRTF